MASLGTRKCGYRVRHKSARAVLLRGRRQWAQAHSVRRPRGTRVVACWSTRDLCFKLRVRENMLKIVVKSSLPGAGGRGLGYTSGSPGSRGGVFNPLQHMQSNSPPGLPGALRVPGGGCNPLQYMQSSSPPGVLGPGGGCNPLQYMQSNSPPETFHKFPETFPKGFRTVDIIKTLCFDIPTVRKPFGKFLEGSGNFLEGFRS